MHITRILAPVSASRRLRAPLLAALVAGAAACGPFHRGGNEPYIRFVNNSMDQADVYAVPVRGDQVRIGTVDAGRTARLRLPTTAVGPDGTVNIVARIFASSRTPRTGRVSITPGQPLEITLPPEENMLSVLPAR